MHPFGKAKHVERMAGQLLAYLERRLEDKAEQELIAHLRGCAACRLELVELRRDFGNRRALPELTMSFLETLIENLGVPVQFAGATRESQMTSEVEYSLESGYPFYGGTLSKPSEASHYSLILVTPEEARILHSNFPAPDVLNLTIDFTEKDLGLKYVIVLWSRSELNHDEIGSATGLGATSERVASANVLKVRITR